MPDGPQARLETVDGLKDIAVEAVTPEWFETLGVSPWIGRSLAAEAAKSPVVVVSHRLWRTELHAAKNVVGNTIRLGGLPRSIAGVMPEGFDFLPGTDAWVLLETVAYQRANLQMIARLREGLSSDQAAAELRTISPHREQGPSGVFGKDGPVLQSFHEFLLGDRRPLLWVLWVVSILFLLLSSAGTANLLLAEGVRRRPDMLIRLLLGARRWRLVRQLLTEAFLLVAAGSAVGLGLSVVAAQWLQTQLPEIREGDAFVPASIGLAAALAVAVTVICGLAPALQATRPDLATSLKSDLASGGVSPSGRLRFSIRECLACAQLALALVLLISTGLLLRSLTARLDMPLGLNTDSVALLSVDLPRFTALVEAEDKFYRDNNMDRFGTYGPREHRALLENMRQTLAPQRAAQEERNREVFRHILQQLGQLPEVESVAALNPVPFTSAATRAVQMSMAVYKENPLRAGTGVRFVAAIHGRLSPAALDVMGVHLVAGRDFELTDVAEEVNAGNVCAACSASAARETPDGTASSGVAIVNKELADRFWPNENPIGKQFHDPPFRPRMVIGVVANFAQTAYNLSVGPAVYYPFTGGHESASVVARLRSDLSLRQFANDANRVVKGLTPVHSRVRVAAMKDLTEDALSNLRFALMLLSGFSMLGVVVSGLSVYASATLLAASRRRETGIRLALGATPGSIRALVLARSAMLSLAALPVGLLAGWGLARLLSHHLFQVSGSDPLTYLVSSAFVVAISVAAGVLPAVNAAATDPVAALRRE